MIPVWGMDAEGDDWEERTLSWPDEGRRLLWVQKTPRMCEQQMRNRKTSIPLGVDHPSPKTWTRILVQNQAFSWSFLPSWAAWRTWSGFSFHHLPKANLWLPRCLQARESMQHKCGSTPGFTAEWLTARNGASLYGSAGLTWKCFMTWLKNEENH